MGSILRNLVSAKAYLVVVFLQFGLAGLAICAKFALNQGMNHYAFVVYRHAIATLVISPFAFFLERKVRPKMSLSTFGKILLLGLLEPVIDQNLYYAGMKFTTATFVTALCNIVPALTFLLAWIFRLEKVNLKKARSLAKVGGTVVTVGGATLMTLVKGPILKLPWTNTTRAQGSTAGSSVQPNPIKGAIMISSGCVCWAAFVILQAMTLKSYPAEMSLTAFICMAGTVEGSLIAFIMERGNTSIWALRLDSILFVYIYSGIICSGMGYYLQGKIMKERGPVFVTSFNPLSMVIVALMGSFMLSEQLSLGRIIGAAVIVTGLYLVIWGKSKDEQKAEDIINPTDHHDDDDYHQHDHHDHNHNHDHKNNTAADESV